MARFDTSSLGTGNVTYKDELSVGPRHYHTNQGQAQYRVPLVLETEFYRKIPNNVSIDQLLLDRGKWLSQASTPDELPQTGILYQIFKDYLEQGFLANDFISVIWDLVTRCQSNRAYEDYRSRCVMSTPKKSDLPKAAMRKVLTDAMDTMNPLVVKTLATAGPEYLKVRAAEAFAANETQFALVLLAWSLVQNDPAVPENA